MFMFCLLVEETRRLFALGIIGKGHLEQTARVALPSVYCILPYLVRICMARNNTKPVLVGSQTQKGLCWMGKVGRIYPPKQRTVLAKRLGSLPAFLAAGAAGASRSPCVEPLASLFELGRLIPTLSHVVNHFSNYGDFWFSY